VIAVSPQGLLPITTFPVNVRFRMHWGEMDAMGHANNTRYFTWFESARVAYFERLSLTLDASGPFGPILAHTACDFLQPVTYPAELIVGARMERLGRTSLTVVQALARAESPEKHLARGSATVVLVNYATGEKVPFPDDVRRAIEALERKT
jgi:acyl-CoA thioester hydrolase